MPLIHIIDLYLTFKFCPLSDKSKASYFSAGSAWADHLHASPPQRQQKRKMMTIIELLLCSIHNLWEKKEETCNFPLYLLKPRPKGCRYCNDFSMVNSGK